MTFQLQNWSRVSVSSNEDIQTIKQMNTTVSPATLYNADVKGCFRNYNYFSQTYTPGVTPTLSGDTQAVIATPGYFDQVFYDLQVYDFIKAYSTVDNVDAIYQVVAISETTPKVTLKLISNHGTLFKIFNPTEIRAMYAAPVLTIPATVGSTIFINSLIFKSSAGVQYTGGSGGNIYFQYGAAAGGLTASTSIGAAMLTTAGGNMMSVESVDATGIATANLIEGQGVYLANATAPFTNAAATQQLGAYIKYSVYPAFAVPVFA